MRPKHLIAIPKDELLCEWSIPLDSNNQYCVYLHYTQDDKLFYIGKGKGNRPFQKNNRNTYWKNIVAKHNLKVIILESNLNEEDAFLLEVKLIEKYQPKANLGRGFLGGSGLQQQSKEANLKRSLASKKYWTNDKRKQRSNKYKKENNPFFGQKHSEVVKQKLKQIRYSPIECVNLITNQTLIVSGTRAAKEFTQINRRQIDLVLKGIKQSFQSWTFKRLK